MGHEKLIGLSEEERKEFLLDSTKQVYMWSEAYRQDSLDAKVFSSLPRIQKDLIDATGYTQKVVDYLAETFVEFSGSSYNPSNNLLGKGKNELEAICDACCNFIDKPSEYNSFSEEYVKLVKSQ